MKNKRINRNDIFNTKEMCSLLERKEGNIHREWNIPSVPVHLETGPFVAYTDNSAYVLNPDHPIFGKEYTKKMSLMTGVLFHEIGHRLFTNFTTSVTFRESLRNGYLYPGKPTHLSKSEKENYEDLIKYISSSDNAQCLDSLLFDLLNSLEDGRIEEMLFSNCKSHKSLCRGLAHVRAEQAVIYPSFSETNAKLEAHELLKYEAYLQSVFCYAKYGEIFGADSSFSTNEILIKFQETKPYIDAFLSAATSVDAYKAYGKLIVSNWDWIKEYVETIKESLQDNNESEPSEEESGVNSLAGHPTEENTSEEGSSEGNSSEEESGNEISSEGNSAKGSSSEGSSSSKFPTGAEVNEEIQKRLQASIKKAETNNATDSTYSHGSDSKNIKEKLKENESFTNRGTTEELSEKSDEVSSDDTPSNTPSGCGPQYTRTSYFDNGVDNGEISRINNYEDDTTTELELDKLFKAVKTRIEDEEAENELRSELNNYISNMDFGDAHKNVSCAIIRHNVSQRNIDEYNAINKELVKLARKMAKKSDFFTDENPNQFIKNKYSGSRFNANSLAKADYRNFSKKIHLEEQPEVAVGVVVDESGSMCGENSKAAKEMAITMYEYCRQMNIPISIIGHTTYVEGCNVGIFVYSDFDKVDESDKYRLMNISSRNANRDGYPVRYMMNRLDERSETSKLLLILSDGCPYDNDYQGRAAMKDLQDIVHTCERKDISLIATAIDDSSSAIKAIYGKNHYLNITDLEELPKTLVSLVKRLLK